MQIGILDLDYYMNKISPNPECMKISSFHKQCGDAVTLIATAPKLHYQWDILYITRVDPEVPLILDLLSKPYARIFGNIEGWCNWVIPVTISACRPDYLLYDEKDTKEQRSDMIQFADVYNRPLKLAQNFNNIFKSKFTLVVDKRFWEFSRDFLIQCLKRLQTYPSVRFFYPIYLKKLINDQEIQEEFLKIKLATNATFCFINDIDSNAATAYKIATFLAQLRAKTVSVGAVEFSAITLNHFKLEKAQEDIERCFDIITTGKRYGVRFEIATPNAKTPYLNLLQMLSDWSKNHYRESFLEYIATPLTRRRHCSVADIYNNQECWDEHFKSVMAMLQAFPQWIEKYCFIQWKDKNFSKSNFSWIELERTII